MHADAKEKSYPKMGIFLKKMTQDCENNIVRSLAFFSSQVCAQARAVGFSLTGWNAHTECRGRWCVWGWVGVRCWKQELEQASENEHIDVFFLPLPPSEME